MSDKIMRSVNRKLDEAYLYLKPYLKDNKELKELCSRCEEHMGAEHDYEECRNKICFKLWLSYEYLKWTTSWEECGGF